MVELPLLLAECGEQFKLQAGTDGKGEAAYESMAEHKMHLQQTGCHTVGTGKVSAPWSSQKYG